MGDSSQNPSSEKMGDSCLKAHLPLSMEAQVFYKDGKETEQRSREETEKFSLCRRAQSTPTRQVMVQCASSWFSRPGSMVEGQQISWSLDASSSEPVSFEVSS